MTGAECAARMGEFGQYRYGASAPPRRLGSDLANAQTVGMIYDEEEGLGFFLDFGLFQETFEHPELVTRPRHADIVRVYLRAANVSPVPFRRCAEAWPQGADQVFAQLLRRPKFSWRRDGETLLRSAKPEYFDRTPMPRFTPFGPDSSPGSARPGPNNSTSR